MILNILKFKRHSLDNNKIIQALLFNLQSTGKDLTPLEHLNFIGLPMTINFSFSIPNIPNIPNIYVMRSLQYFPPQHYLPLKI